MPWLRDGGEIELLPIGLDKPSGSLCADPGFEITSMPLPEAVAELESLLEEFPWPGDNGRSKAVAIAAMLTTFAGGIMPPRSAKPVFIYVANAEGSGKTTLAQLAGLPYTESPAEAAPRTEEEWQKKLLALVISGRRLVILDNLKGHLNSPAFEAYTSTATFGGRILGGSREFTGEAGATILITGNGLTFTADLRRRSLVVELFMPQLRAEDRTYKRRLSPSAILRLRPRVLSALWGIISAWDQAGRPRPSKVNGSFPEWCETICAIVEFAKWGSPVAEAQIDGMGDTDTADFEKLASAMEPGTNYTFQSLAVIIEEAGLFDRIVSDKESGELSQRAKAKLATILKQFSNRRVSETKVFRVISSGHQRRYAILPPAR
jgi:hypothetical protein